MGYSLRKRARPIAADRVRFKSRRPVGTLRKQGGGSHGRAWGLNSVLIGGTFEFGRQLGNASGVQVRQFASWRRDFINAGASPVAIVHANISGIDPTAVWVRGATGNPLLSLSYRYRRRPWRSARSCRTEVIPPSCTDPSRAGFSSIMRSGRRCCNGKLGNWRTRPRFLGQFIGRNSEVVAK